MSSADTLLGDIIKPAALRRAGVQELPILSMTMRDGLVDQADKFKKRVASSDTSAYRVVDRGQLVVGFPIDEGVLSFQRLYDSAIVSPAYEIWDLVNPDSVSRDFLERFLRSPRALKYYAAKLQGSTARRRSLPRDVFLALSVPLPPLEEQQRITAVLDQVDNLRAKRRKAIALLGDLIQSMLIHMFQFEDFPKEPLSEVVRKGTIVTYGIVQAGDEFDGGVPYIRTGDLKDGEIITDGLRHTDPSIAAKFVRSRVAAGDIVMSIRATVGNTALVPAELDGANLTQGTARIAPGDKVTPEYLLAYLRSREAQSWIQRQVKGATFREITLAKLRELEVPLPSFAQQLDFSQRVKAVEAQLGVHRTHLAALDELFTSVQHRAFSGTLWDYEAAGEAA
ncbi:restriction endonuclease subunit S [Streptomyces bacillaris]